MKSSSIRFISVLVAAALFAAIGLWNEVNTWNRLLTSSNNRLVETARVIGLHTDDVLALAEQPLADLTLKAQAATGYTSARRHVLDEMVRWKQTSQVVRSIDYVGPDGRLLGSTQASSTVGSDRSSWENLRFHRQNASEETYIGTAIRDGSDDEWFLPISRRISAADGSFAGVMIATVDLDRFFRFIESFNPGGDSAYFLMRGDGQVLMRYPLRPQGMKAGLADIDFFASQAKSGTEGNHQYDAPGGRGPRMSGYVSSEQTGVTAIATRSRSALFHSLLVRSKYPWMTMIAAYILGLAITFRWLRQIRLREIGDQKIAAREAEFRLIADASRDVIEKITIDGRRDYVSTAATRIFEQAPEALVGTNVLDVADQQARDDWQAALDRLKAGSSSESILMTRTRSDGSKMWLESVLSRVNGETNDSPCSIVVVTRDATRQQLAKQELDALAITDELTGLFNKRHFNQQLGQMVMRNAPMSLLLFDLDRFKLFNDTYGHLAGDGCLRDVARAIRETLQGTDAVAARYGGEELAVLLPGYDEPMGLQVAENLRLRIRSLQIAHVNNQPHGVVTASLGLAALDPKHPMSAEALISAADEALYRAKNMGRNQVVSATADLARPLAAASA
ncbi:diguanylate cyclase [Rhizobium sp. RU36D]|uniref:sensor domain-containing diguanylate cyclase n=1 Tax=Rhizobium sp. RU36D TaxID=1907415 RepID=UPI0009D7CFF4|nr:diguanylate cyclase [Rhizobium sp. RU36D]SMC42267.1 diguanylate cyclase with PAS/PAC sensor [Rhizobium sp. RU36D]